MLFSSCSENNDPPEPLYAFNKGDGYFVLNEGGFTKGNASVDFVYEGKDSVIYHIFENANSKALGDVLQSAVVRDDKMYLVINNSGLIRVVDIGSFEEVTTITGFNSPRYMQIIDDEKAYVSDQYADKLWIVDLNSHTITDSIKTGGWTEEMVMAGELVYITSPSSYSGPASKSVFVVNSSTDELIETLTLRTNPFNIIKDGQNQIHVFCQGDPFADPVIAPSMHSIDPSGQNEITVKLMPNLPIAYHSRLKLSADGEAMYLLYGSIYEIDILESGISYANIPLVDADGRNFYGIGIHPGNGNIFITDAFDYSSRGTIYEYKTNAVEVNQYNAGIIPSRLIWY
jgi:hypothetical protein